MVTYLFPADPLRGSSWAVDDHFAREHRVASESASVALIDSYSLSTGAKLRIPEDASSPIVYRGWMLTADEYRALQRAVEARGYQLLTGLPAYLETHRMSGWVDRFEGLTPETVILPGSASAEELVAAAAGLPSGRGFFLKGQSKSEAGASSVETVRELPGLLQRFRELAEPDSEDELVLRSLIPLDSAVPELRSWWLRGELFGLDAHPNFSSLDGPASSPIDPSTVAEKISTLLATSIEQLHSDFLTADLALTTEGEWILLELGDGQVSGLRQDYSENRLREFYEGLSLRLDGP